jgi:hypothetical protein
VIGTHANPRQATSLEQAKAVVEARPETKLFDVDIVPINQFPHFD